MKLAQYKLEMPICTMYLVATETALRGIFWKPQTAPLVESLEGELPALKILAATVAQLREYFAGERKVFDLPLDLVGTDFQRKVWNELLKIPYGQTRSYTDLAKSINNLKAIRAVGAANGKNPISIIVPCHRVIAANGTLCGYAGGLPIKEKLLKLENEKN